MRELLLCYYSHWHKGLGPSGYIVAMAISRARHEMTTSPSNCYDMHCVVFNRHVACQVYCESDDPR